MSNCLVLNGGDQERREQDVRHLPVEEVHPVVRLGHHGGVVPARGVVLHALPQNQGEKYSQLSGFGMKEPGPTRFTGKTTFYSRVRQAEDRRAGTGRVNAGFL